MKVFRSTLKEGDKFIFEGVEFKAEGKLGGRSGIHPPYKTINMIEDYTVEINPPVDVDNVLDEMVSENQKMGLYEPTENPMIKKRK